MSRGAVLTLFIGLVFGGAIGLAFDDLRQIARGLTTGADADTPRFAEEKPSVMRRKLWPEGMDPENPDFALILTENATGTTPVMIEDAEALRLYAHGADVHYRYHSTGDTVAIGILSLGIALRHYRRYALLVHDGQVVDAITCWKCDVTRRDFQGTKLTALIDAGTPMTRQQDDFTSETEYEAALKEAQNASDTWVDTTASMGRQDTTTGPRWTLTTWRKADAP